MNNPYIEENMYDTELEYQLAVNISEERKKVRILQKSIYILVIVIVALSAAIIGK